MGRETKIGFDQPFPDELVLIVVFALFLVAVFSLLFGVMQQEIRGFANFL
jgi:hypothetical protein